MLDIGCQISLKNEIPIKFKVFETNIGRLDIKGIGEIEIRYELRLASTVAIVNVDFCLYYSEGNFGYTRDANAVRLLLCAV